MNQHKGKCGTQRNNHKPEPVWGRFKFVDVPSSERKTA